MRVKYSFTFNQYIAFRVGFHYRHQVNIKESYNY